MENLVTSESSPLSVLQLGAGHFGRQHLAVWQKLEQRGLARIAGVVVQSERSRQLLERQYPSWPILTDYGKVDLDTVDVVDIVTPSETHAGLVKRFLAHCHVYVEKPLYTNQDEAEKLKELVADSTNVLMAGHLYRFSPVVIELQRRVRDWGAPLMCEGQFTNPRGEAYDAEINAEFLHLYDIGNLLFGGSVQPHSTLQQDRHKDVEFTYIDGPNARFRLGWTGWERVRWLRLTYSDMVVHCDLVDQAIRVTTHEDVELWIGPADFSPLTAALESFLSAVRSGSAPAVRAETAIEIVNQALQTSKPSPTERRPRAAVIGAGLFGVTCANELSAFCDVDIFERNDRLFSEASSLNQWRHHSGFHYPLSADTIDEVQGAKAEFEQIYGKYVRDDVESYYCTSAFGNQISRGEYLQNVSRHGLKFSEEWPEVAEMVARDRVSLCIKTDESILDVDQLSADMTRQLARPGGPSLYLKTAVAGARFLSNAKKQLTLDAGGSTRTEEYDYVINAGYAESNRLAAWLGLPRRKLRFDYLELAVVELSIPKIAVTVLDGPFTSLTPMVEDGRFMLSHIYQSLLSSKVTEDGLPPQWGERRSNAANLLHHGLRYFPILKSARYIGSRYGIRTVYAFSEDFYGRPTVVTDHGFGCWSVLGGKLLTCVTNAREIAGRIRSTREQRQPPDDYQRAPLIMSS